MKGLTYLDYSQVLDAINHLLPVKAEPTSSLLTSGITQSDGKMPGSDPAIGHKSSSISEQQQKELKPESGQNDETTTNYNAVQFN